MMEKRVLIVDDEEMIRESFEMAFMNAGYPVRTARTAEDALEIMAETPHWLLFLDLNLPGMSGVELCRRIRDQYPMAISIAVTGYASLFELNECRLAGFEDYFIKPVELSALLGAAGHAFEKLKRWRKG
jgi:DNA-binding NtrC family response regulator